MKHHSATFEIADRAGVHPRTVQRYARGARRRWLRVAQADAELIVAALLEGRGHCFSQPRRYAVPFEQLTLDWD